MRCCLGRRALVACLLVIVLWSGASLAGDSDSDARWWRELDQRGRASFVMGCVAGALRATRAATDYAVENRCVSSSTCVDFRALRDRTVPPRTIDSQLLVDGMTSVFADPANALLGLDDAFVISWQLRGDDVESELRAARKLALDLREMLKKPRK